MSNEYIMLTYEHAKMIREALENSKPIPSAGMIERLDRHAKALLAIIDGLREPITLTEVEPFKPRLDANSRVKR